MTITRKRVAAVLTPAAIAVISLAGMPVATAQAAGASWQLTDQYTSHPACYTTAGGTEYLELNVNGTWSSPLNFGSAGLPAGGSASDAVLDENLTNDTWSTGSVPVPAGWSNGTGPLSVGPNTIAEAYLVTKIPAGLPANSTVTVTFWASVGGTTQSESVPIAIKSSCARRY